MINCDTNCHIYSLVNSLQYSAYSISTISRPLIIYEKKYFGDNNQCIEKFRIISLNLFLYASISLYSSTICICSLFPFEDQFVSHARRIVGNNETFETGTKEAKRDHWF